MKFQKSAPNGRWQLVFGWAGYIRKEDKPINPRLIGWTNTIHFLGFTVHFYYKPILVRLWEHLRDLSNSIPK